MTGTVYVNESLVLSCTDKVRTTTVHFVNTTVGGRHMPFITLIGYIVAAVIMCSFAYWVVTNYLPEPIKKFGVLVVVAIAVIFICWIILAMTGSGTVPLPGFHR